MTNSARRYDDTAFISLMREYGTPEAVVQKYIDTGILDFTLWPIRVPVVYSAAPDANP